MINCEECKWGYENHCCVIRCMSGCYQCDNFDSDILECNCTKILSDDPDQTDECPYFEEYEE